MTCVHVNDINYYKNAITRAINNFNINNNNNNDNNNNNGIWSMRGTYAVIFLSSNFQYYAEIFHFSNAITSCKLQYIYSNL